MGFHSWASFHWDTLARDRYSEREARSSGQDPGHALLSMEPDPGGEG